MFTGLDVQQIKSTKFTLLQRPITILFKKEFNVELILPISSIMKIIKLANISQCNKYITIKTKYVTPIIPLFLYTFPNIENPLTTNEVFLSTPKDKNYIGLYTYP